MSTDFRALHHASGRENTNNQEYSGPSQTSDIKLFTSRVKTSYQMFYRVLKIPLFNF